MRDAPAALDLLAQAREELSSRALPAASGELRLSLLMIASALGMVERELRDGARIDLALSDAEAAASVSSPQALARAIRDGHHDGSEAVFAALDRLSLAGLAIARPQALGASEREALQRLDNAGKPRGEGGSAREGEGFTASIF